MLQRPYQHSIEPWETHALQLLQMIQNVLNEIAEQIAGAVCKHYDINPVVANIKY